MRVHCATCHREERWGADGARSVVLAGGSRRPSSSAERVSFDVMHDAVLGRSGPVVGACACGLPLIADAPDAAGRFVLTLPVGELAIDGRAATLNGEAVDLDALAVKVHQAYPAIVSDGASPFQRLFAGSLLTMMMVPVVVWVWTVSVVIVFYSHWANGGGSVGMP